jgi:cytochrome bd-type quinol oxidase subunit 1
MPESDSPPVADRAWRVRLLVVDGVLVVLLAWLLFMVIRDRDASKEPVSADNVEVLTPIDGATPTSDR